MEMVDVEWKDIRVDDAYVVELRATLRFRVDACLHALVERDEALAREAMQRLKVKDPRDLVMIVQQGRPLDPPTFKRRRRRRTTP